MKIYKIYLLIAVFFTFSAKSATVSMDFPELNTILNKVNLTSSPLMPYDPCNYIPATITCTNDSLNLEITLIYPIEVTVTNIAMNQVITLNMQATPEMAKEFKYFIIKEGSTIASFPRMITSNEIINYNIEIKMDYFGVDSIPENSSFFEVNLSSN